MEELDLKALWQSYNHKLDHSIRLNQELLMEAKMTKVRRLLSAVRPVRIFAVITGIIWVLFLYLVLKVAWHADNYFLLVSAGIHTLVIHILLVISIFHLFLIYDMRQSEFVLKTQKQLAQFRQSTLLGIRLSALQMPVFTTFYLSEGFLINGGPIMWTVHAALFISFAAVGIWAFRNFVPANRDKKWFQFIVGDRETEALDKAEDLLDQIGEWEENV
ncbi:MAG: hypothetical protein AAF206_01730 [Bacteroidota bacterium]